MMLKIDFRWVFTVLSVWDATRYIPIMQEGHENIVGYMLHEYIYNVDWVSIYIPKGSHFVWTEGAVKCF